VPRQLGCNLLWNVSCCSLARGVSTLIGRFITLISLIAVTFGGINLKFFLNRWLSLLLGSVGFGLFLGSGEILGRLRSWGLSDSLYYWACRSLHVDMRSQKELKRVVMRGLIIVVENQLHCVLQVFEPLWVELFKQLIWGLLLLDQLVQELGS
jgi:hypothetical protein